MPVALAERWTDAQHDTIEERAQEFQRIADRRVPSMQRDIFRMLATVRAESDLQKLEQGVERNDWLLIREAIPLVDTVVALRKASDEEQFASDIARVFSEASHYALQLVPDFEIVDRFAVDFAASRAGVFLSTLDADAIATAREAVAFGIENGRTVAETARFIQQSLYLPERAMNAVENYFRALIDRVERGESLAEAARFTGRTRALAPRKFLDAQNIDTLVGRYSERWLDFTAKTAARTMTIESSNAGLREGWNQAARAGLFDPSTAVLVWYATADDLTCPECQGLNGTEVGFADGSWDTSFGNVFYPPAHPRCRCTLVIVLASGGSLPTYNF